MAMDPPPSDRPRPRRPYPIPPPPAPERGAPGPNGRKVHARDLIDRLPEPDPALVRDHSISGPRHLDRSPRGRARQHRRPRGGRRSWGQRLLLCVLIVAALVSGTAAAVAGYFSYKLDQIAYVDVELSDAPAPGEPRNLLIVGSDSRDRLADGAAGDGIDTGAFVGDGTVGSGQRSDTIIVVRVDPAAEAVSVLSIPRDLWVAIPGSGRSQRINTAYGGGPQQLVDTIEENLDIPVHHYVEVDFVGFAGLVEAVGGVPVWFDTPVRDEHAGLRVDAAGCHVLDPQAALAYARSRHLEYQTDAGRWAVDGTGDLGRISRQHVFLRRAIDQVAQLGVADALTLNRLLDVGIDSVTLDRGLGLNQLRDLASRFATFDSSDMQTFALPTTPFRTSGGASVLRLLEADAQPALNLFRGLPPDTLAPVQVQHVTVLNGTGEDGKAALVADALEQVGFGVEDVGNVDETGGDTAGARRTTIRHAPGAAAHADLVERHLTSGADVVVDRSLDELQVVLEVGTDLTTIGRNPRPGDPPVTTTTTGTPTSPASDAGSPTGGPGMPDTDPVGVAPDPSVRCG